MIRKLASKNAIMRATLLHHALIFLLHAQQLQHANNCVRGRREPTLPPGDAARSMSKCFIFLFLGSLSCDCKRLSSSSSAISSGVENSTSSGHDAFTLSDLKRFMVEAESGWTLLPMNKCHQCWAQ